jgi:hypothetical protein
MSVLEFWKLTLVQSALLYFQRNLRKTWHAGTFYLQRRKSAH